MLFRPSGFFSAAGLSIFPVPFFWLFWLLCLSCPTEQDFNNVLCEDCWSKAVLWVLQTVLWSDEFSSVHYWIHSSIFFHILFFHLNSIHSEFLPQMLDDISSLPKCNWIKENKLLINICVICNGVLIKVRCGAVIPQWLSLMHVPPFFSRNELHSSIILKKGVKINYGSS